MELEKYIRKGKNKYKVKIDIMQDGIKPEYSYIKVYLYTGSRKWFSNNSKRVYTKTYYYNSPEFYDYKLAAMNTVDSYEESIDYAVEQTILKSENEFKKWDGEIKAKIDPTLYSAQDNSSMNSLLEQINSLPDEKVMYIFPEMKEKPIKIITNKYELRKISDMEYELVERDGK